jgi:HD superfamily phosphohydrolase YqeK
MNQTDTLSDVEIVAYLNDIAREFKSDKMKQVADRFSELTEQEREIKWLQLLLDWK